MSTSNSTVIEMLESAVKAAGANGLCHPRSECGCGIDDLAPCEGPKLDCVLARVKVVDGEEQFIPIDHPQDQT